MTGSDIPPRPPQLDWVLLAIAYVGFVSLGLPDAVTGVAWPTLRERFGVSQGDLGWVFVSVGSGYFLSGFFAGPLTAVLGVGRLLSLSCLLVALGMLGTTVVPFWWTFAALGAVWGLGSGAVDAALNAYVAGHFPARHVNWLHACYSLGATCGPLVMTAALVRAGSWRLGYLIVGGALTMMATGFLATRRRWETPARADAPAPAPPAGMTETLRHPVVWGNVCLFLLYGGVEATVGQWSFTYFTEGRGLDAAVAGLAVAGYYGAIGVGRVLAGFIADRLGVDRLLRLSTAGALLGAVLLAFGGRLGPAAVLLIGLSLAAIFPCLMVRTPQRLGRLSGHAIGFQVAAATVGIAGVPSLVGLLAESGLDVIPRAVLLLAALLFGGHEILVFATRAKVPA